MSNRSELCVLDCVLFLSLFDFAYVCLDLNVPNTARSDSRVLFCGVCPKMSKRTVKASHVKEWDSNTSWRGRKRDDLKSATSLPLCVCMSLWSSLCVRVFLVSVSISLHYFIFDTLNTVCRTDTFSKIHSKRERERKQIIV